MKKMLLVLLVALVGLAGPGCIIVDTPGDVPSGFDFNGVWTFAMTGCQHQTGNATITQSGTAIDMASSGLFWTGSCDPIAETFSMTSSGPWGFWTFQGGAVGADVLQGTYLYEDFRGQCTGSFTATRIAFLKAAPVDGRPLQREP